MRLPAGIAMALGALFAAAASATIAAEPEFELRRNPFERPVIEQAASPATNSGGSKSTGNPGLRAVLVAGAESVVNFGGVLLQIGESSNGYELIAVEEGVAVFRNKGKTIVFSVYEKDKESTL